MINVTDRFTRDKTDSLQHAFFQRQRLRSLEKPLGFWYPMNPAMPKPPPLHPQSNAPSPLISSAPDWQPHTPTLQAGVFASKFPLPQRTLWNHRQSQEFDLDGQQLRVPYSPASTITISGRRRTPGRASNAAEASSASQ